MVWPKRLRRTTFPIPPKDLGSFCWKCNLLSSLRSDSIHPTTTTRQEAMLTKVQVCSGLITVLPPTAENGPPEGEQHKTAFSSKPCSPAQEPTPFLHCSKGRVTGILQNGDTSITQSWAGEKTQAAYLREHRYHHRRLGQSPPPLAQRSAALLSSYVKSNLQYLDWWGSLHLSASCLSDYTYFFCKESREHSFSYSVC